MKPVWCSILFFVAIWNSSIAHATLILTVPTKDGLLIVSDRMRVNRGTGSHDEIAKVIRLGTNAAITVTGTVGFSFGRSGQVNMYQPDQMIALDLAREYFRTNELKPFDVFKFANTMAAGYSNHLAFHISVTNRDFNGCQYIFMRVDSSRERHTFIASLTPLRIGPNIGFSVTCQQSLQNDGDAARIAAYGQADVPIELLRGHDSRFASIRNRPIVKKFLPNPPPIKKVTLEDAEAFARFIMLQSAEKTTLLTPLAAIGTNFDETLLVPAIAENSK